MKKKQVQRLRYAATFLVSIAVGVGGSYVWNWAARPVSAPAAVTAAATAQTDGVQVRVRGGDAEWFDGVRWNTAGALEQLEQSDPTTVQSETWRLLAQQRSDAKQQQRETALTQLSREANALSTGEKPAAQTRRPAASTTPAATTPPPAQPPVQTQTPPPAQQPEPEQTSSGDGEDMSGVFD